MGVAGDDDIDSLTGRVAPERLEVVDDVEPNPGQRGRHGFRNRCCPGLAVVVAAHRDDRRDFSELVEDRGGANVARVHDHVDAG